MAWVATTLGLVGVLVGAAVSYTTTAWRARADFSREVSLRQEVASREAIAGFLDAAEGMERAALNRFFDRPHDDEWTQRQLWFRQKVLQISCNDNTGRASLDYASRLHAAVYGDEVRESGEAPWDWVRAARDQFLNAAQAEVRGYLQDK